MRAYVVNVDGAGLEFNFFNAALEGAAIHDVGACCVSFCFVRSFSDVVIFVTLAAEVWGKDQMLLRGSHYTMVEVIYPRNPCCPLLIPLQPFAFCVADACNRTLTCATLLVSAAACVCLH